MASAIKPLLRVSWTEMTQSEGAPKPRSSHAAAVVGQKAYVFGGELEPRVPIDNLVHIFDLESRTWTATKGTGDAPLPRVGVTMAAVDGALYIFAGRDQEHEELNELFSFDVETEEWKLLSHGAAGPPHRSYHALVADEDRKRLYAFGGCGKEGRLNDLWVFEIRIGQWSLLHASPAHSSLLPRGGPGLATIDGAVWVIFGFNGSELSDIHRFDVEKSSWEEIKTSGDVPTGRSVFGTAVIGRFIVIYGGEVDPSDQGHLGAGAFSSEVFALDTKSLIWSRPELSSKEGGSDPGARGWYAAATCGNSMLVYGGNSDSNDRLEDMYVLKIREVD